MVREKATQVQESEDPNQEEPKEAHSKTLIIKMAKFKDKERILKEARET